MKPLIYILEDDADIANVIARTLRDEGFSIEAFQRKGSFLNQFQRKRPDLCLIDLALPDGDGLSVITEFLRTHRVPAIVVTGKSGLADKIIGLEVGADVAKFSGFTADFQSCTLMGMIRSHPSCFGQCMVPGIYSLQRLNGSEQAASRPTSHLRTIQTNFLNTDLRMINLGWVS